MVEAKNVGVSTEEGGGATVEVEGLGETVEEVDRNGGGGGDGARKNEVLDGNYFLEVFVFVHEFFEGVVSESGGNVLGRGGFAAAGGGGSGGGGEEIGSEFFEELGCHLVWESGMRGVFSRRCLGRENTTADEKQLKAGRFLFSSGDPLLT